MEQNEFQNKLIEILININRNLSNIANDIGRIECSINNPDTDSESITHSLDRIADSVSYIRHLKEEE